MNKKRVLLSTTVSLKFQEYFSESVYELTIAQLVEFHESFLAYLFKASNFNTFWAKVKKLLPVDSLTSEKKKELRSWVIHDGYHIKTVKYSIYKFIKDQSPWSAKTSDKFYLKLLNEKSQKSINRTIKKFPLMTPVELDKLVVWVTLQNKTFTQKFVNRKMRFIMNSDVLKADDLIQELTWKGVHEVYRQYPAFPNSEYVINLYKCAVHDYGINLIQKLANPKHSRILKVNGQSQGKVYSMNTTEAQLKELGLQDYNEDYESIDLKVVFDNLSKTVRGRYKLFLELVMGHPNKEFDTYLIEQGHKRDSETIFNKNPTKLVNLAMDFTDIPEEKRPRFMAFLQKQFKEYA